MEPVIMQVKIDDEELSKVITDLAEAQETIYRCYSRLKNLGILEINTKKAASGD